MSSIDVVYTKRREDRDKSTGEKVIIEAGASAKMTKTEYEKASGYVRRIVKDKPVIGKAAAADSAPPVGDGDGSEGNEGGDDE